MKKATIDEYIAGFSPEIQVILQTIRATIRAAAPEAEEKISYQLPTFALHGNLVHFGAFKHHIGLYPPVTDASLARSVARYAGTKGNLSFPLDEPIPYALIGRIVRARVRENRRLSAVRGRKR